MAEGPRADETHAAPAGRRDFLLPCALGILLLGLVLRVAPLWSSQPDLGHGWIVGCFLGWWLAERWRTRPAPIAVDGPARPSLALLALLGIALLVPVRLLLTPYPYWPAMLWAWSAGLLALAAFGLWLAGGRGWLRHFGFAAILIATALPWPQAVQRAIFEPLRNGITLGAAEVLNLAGYPTVAHGTTLKVLGRWVGMEEACGGIRSLQLALALAVVVGEAARFTLRRRLFAVGVAALAALLANFGRVLFLSWRAAEGVQGEDPLHDASGYVAYALLAAVLGSLAWRWHGAFENAAAVNAPRRAGGASRLWIGTAALGAVLLELGTLVWYAPGGQRWRPTWAIQLPRHAPYFTAIPLAPSAREMLQPDRFEAGSWVGPDRVARTVFYAEWRGGQIAGQVPFVHNPTVCFPYAGCRLERELGTVRVTVGDREIPFRGYAFVRAGQGILAYFAVWDVDRDEELADARSTGGWSGWWRARIRMVAARRAEIRAQLLTVALIGDPARIAATDESAVRSEIESLLTPAGPTF